MKKIVINRLFQSFLELEQAIESARTTLSKKKNVPAEVLKRIESYEEILEKQRDLATALCGHASLGNWDEVTRHVKLINGLSFFIRDDAREMIASASPTHNHEQHDMILC